MRTRTICRGPTSDVGGRVYSTPIGAGTVRNGSRIARNHAPQPRSTSGHGAVGDLRGGIRFSVRPKRMWLTQLLLCDSLMPLIFSLITPENFPVMELKIPCSCF